VIAWTALTTAFSPLPSQVRPAPRPLAPPRPRQNEQNELPLSYHPPAMARSIQMGRPARRGRSGGRRSS